MAYSITQEKVVKTAFDLLNGVYGKVYYRRDNNLKNYGWQYNVMTWYKDHFCSDCLGFVHSVVNGFNGNKNVVGGGALVDSYLTSTTESETLKQTVKSNDFHDMYPGELLYMPGHVGFYVGEFIKDGHVYNAAENTMSWNKGLQPSYVDEKGRRFKYRGSLQNGSWVYHGKINRVVYSEKPKPVKEDTFMTVLEWQAWCNAAGYKTSNGQELLLDGDFGSNCVWVANNKAVVSLGKGGKHATKLVQAIVGANVDGDPGQNTKNAIIAWQKKNGLTADGVFGSNSWKKALGL